MNSTLQRPVISHCPPAVYADIARILHDRTGINLPDDNGSLVVSRLVKHLRQLQLPDFESYVRWIVMPQHRDDMNTMISALTTNTTRFFREPYHFDVFVKSLLPHLISRAKSGERIRLWSAGCSSGEEPYSLAATLLNHWPDVADFDVRILATDICAPALKTAQDGQYLRKRLDGVPDPIRALMLSETDSRSDTVIMPKAVRKLIAFRYLNFMEPWPTRGPFQAIFFSVTWRSIWMKKFNSACGLDSLIFWIPVVFCLSDIRRDYPQVNRNVLNL